MRDMRWKCEDKGCYRKLMPRLGMLDDCFPGKIGMSDIDGIVEVGGRFLVMEFKSAGSGLTTGQRIMFERLTAENLDPMKFTVIVVCGDPQEMVIESVQVFSSGKAGPVEPCTLEQLRLRIRKWRERAERCKTRPSKRAAA